MKTTASVRSLLRVGALVLAACLPAACAPDAHSADAHGHPHEAEGPAPRTLTLVGRNLLVYIQHPHLARGVEAEFLVHATLLASGEPVRAGSAVLEIGTARIEAAGPKRDGLFVPKGAAAQAGSFAGKLAIRCGEASEDFELGAVVVHADAKTAEDAARAEKHEDPPGAVPFLLEQQWQIKLLVAAAAPAKIARHLKVPVRIASQDGAEAVVSSTVAGRLVVDGGRTLPVTGSVLRAGQVIGVVEPPLTPADAAQLAALRTELELQAVQATQRAAEARETLRYAEAEAARQRALRAQGLGRQQQLDEAESAAALARAAESAAQAALAAIDEARKARGQSAAFPLVAPADGTVVGVRAVAGQSVAAGEELVRTLDTKRLRAVAYLPEAEVSRLLEVDELELSVAALPGRTLRFSPSVARLAARFDETSRTLPVHIDFEAPDELWKAGMAGELAVRTGTTAAAVAVPLDAIVQDQGVPTAWVMVSGETFVRRVLELGVRDDALVEVRSGLAPGERVATRGANLVRLASMSPEGFGHGHAH